MNIKVKYFLYGVIAIPSLYGMYQYFKDHMMTFVFLVAFIVLVPLIQLLKAKKD